MLVDAATMIAGGGEAIADIDTHKEQLLGAVASAPTVWRALDELTPARVGKGGEGPPRPAPGCGG